MTLEELRKNWIGRNIGSSVDHGLDESGRHPRPVESIDYDAEYEQYVAWAGEHHRANTADALNRRLHQLASKLLGPGGREEKRSEK